MSNQSFKEIRTRRLQLSKLSPSDWNEVSFLRSSPVVNAFVKRPHAPNKESALNFIENIRIESEQEQSYYWKISEGNKIKMIGSVCLWNFSKDRKQAEIGYDLHPHFHRQGLMSEALKTVLNFGFKELGLLRIEAFTQSNNRASKRLLESNGFKVLVGRTDVDNPQNIIYALSST